MGPADVVVVFNDQSGVAQARSFLTGVSPAIQANPTRVWTKTDLNGTAPSWATIAISVTRAAAATGSGGVPISIGLAAAPNTFIFAWSDDTLTFGDNGAIGLSPHGANRYGIKGRITKGASGIVALPSGMSRASIVMIHAVVMAIALVLLPPIGIFFAMYMREKLGSMWLSVHMGIMVGGVGLLSVIGAVIAFLFKPGPHFASIHQIAGMAIIVLILLQIAFGFVAKTGYNPTTSSPQTMTQVHRYFGFFLYAIMIPVQTYLGFSEYKAALGTAAPMYLIAIPALFAVIGVGLLVAGYFIFPYGDSSFGGGKVRLGGINTFPIEGFQREFMPLEETMSPTSPIGYGGMLGATTRGGSRNGRMDEVPETVGGVNRSGSRSGHEYVGASGVNRNGSRAGREEYVAGVNRNGSRGGRAMVEGNSHGGMNSSRGGRHAVDDHYSGSSATHHQPQHSGNAHYGGSQQQSQGGSKYNDHSAQQQQQQQVQSGRDYPRSPATHAAEYEYKPRSGNSRNAAGGGGGGSGNGREYTGSRVRGPQSQSRSRAGDEH
ncbi:hypothetical protein HDU81_008411 [Chytriomyces hyalinus]|nr:hypothetical protein HDU81_008411 [Chytriomyces hyalinus]